MAKSGWSLPARIGLAAAASALFASSAIAAPVHRVAAESAAALVSQAPPAPGYGRIQVRTTGYLPAADIGGATAPTAAPAAAQGILNRVVCDNQSDPTTVYQCEVTDIYGPTATTVGRKEGDAAVEAPLDQQINQVYDLLGDTYDYYLSMFTDGGGMPYDLTDRIGFRDRNNNDYRPVLSATVNSCGAATDGKCSTNNAFWLPADNSGGASSSWFVGGSMQISAGLASLADVIAHELQHGVTAEIAGLEYQGQAGAINESLSDIFGQAVDLYRQQRWNLPKDDWTVGEGIEWSFLPGESIPYLRSMKDPLRLPAVSNPALTFPLYVGQAASCRGWQPDKMSSPCWDTDPKNEDSGGVHSNSGVGNHLAYLLSAGGNFNGRTIKPLGQANAMRLWWATLNNLGTRETYFSLGRQMWNSCIALQSTAAVDKVLPVGACNASVRPALQATEVSMRAVTWGSSLPAQVKAGTQVSVRATVSDFRRAGVRQGIAGQRLVFQRLAGRTWVAVGSALTNSQGRAALSARISRAGSYRYAIAADGASPLAASRSVTIRVTR